ncbi:MAG: pyridoxamine 5'-phosphate oxidase family protein [Anaerolineae bacterium]|nr:pyridoxamine 5'-phosphate oxidase family protein [Anaerolineae bacterium]
MLDKLRDQALNTLAAGSTCTLSSSGPAGLQASVIPYRVADHKIYILIPTTSDHLFNLETEPRVILTTPEWQLTGTAAMIEPPPSLLALFTSQETRWQQWVEITPQRIQLEPGPSQPRITVDFQ